MTQYICANCEFRTTREEAIIPLEEVKDLASRLDPGSVVPAGECPECGALLYQEPEEYAEDSSFNHIQRRLYLHTGFNDRGERTKVLQRTGDNLTATGVMLVEYCPTTLKYYFDLYSLARKAFPGLSSEAVECGRVRRSNVVDGHTLVYFDLTSYLGWKEDPARQGRRKPLIGQDGTEWPIFVNIEFEY